ncbi:unnamed protein product [Thelazia callipaeda]|uniref:DUF4777 domain-containing protein n=1 Tax=Thelazia callipaeda TaxID=103827 RepID=A0A0N5CTZ1_THECL|nr:unnamed protein product [Thelazia callipaeda]
MKLAELTSKKVTSLGRETIEILIAKLILDKYLEEHFHYTPYSIISYVVLGERSTILKHNPKHQIEYPIPSNSLTLSKKQKPVSRKRPLVIDDDDVVI